MRRSRIAEIRRAAKSYAPDIRMVVEELLIEIETSGNPGELPLMDERKPASKARGTLEEFQAAALAMGLQKSDGAYFHARMEASGWLLRGQPVKDWRAAMRSWMAAAYFPSQRGDAKPSGPRRTAL